MDKEFELEIDFKDFFHDEIEITEPNHEGTGHIRIIPDVSVEEVTEMVLRAPNMSVEDINDYDLVWARQHGQGHLQMVSADYVVSSEIDKETGEPIRAESIQINLTIFDEFSMKSSDYYNIPLSEKETEQLKNLFNAACMEKKGLSLEDVVLNIKLGAEKEVRERERILPNRPKLHRDER